MHDLVVAELNDGPAERTEELAAFLVASTLPGSRVPLCAHGFQRAQPIRIGEVDLGDDDPVHPDGVAALGHRQPVLTDDVEQHHLEAAPRRPPFRAQVQDLLQDAAPTASSSTNLREPSTERPLARDAPPEGIFNGTLDEDWWDDSAVIDERAVDRRHRNLPLHSAIDGIPSERSVEDGAPRPRTSGLDRRELDHG